jgi:hypothetical protein
MKSRERLRLPGEDRMSFAATYGETGGSRETSPLPEILV